MDAVAERFFMKGRVKGNEYIDCGSYVEIVCISGKHGEFRVKIDHDDRIKCQEKTWGVRYAPKIDGFYACTYKNNPEEYYSLPIHRFIMDAPKGLVVDHINHDTLDNRKSNLRIINNADNMMNRKGVTSHNKSGVRGVWFCQTKKGWRVEVRKKNLGLYDTIDEAKAVADWAIGQYLNNIGNPNFIIKKKKGVPLDISKDYASGEP